MNETLVVIVRAIIGFFSLLIFTRMLGKQQISQLTFFDYILGITIGSIAATLTTDLTSRAWPHWVGLFAWAFLVYIIQLITLKWRKASVYIAGEPTIIIMNGKVMEGVMKKLRYRASDLLEQLRREGVFDIKEVEYAILETDGKFSVLKKSQHQPVTPNDLGITTPYKGLSTELIYDGQLFKTNLKQVDKDEEWLKNQLRARGFGSYREVFLAVIDASGNLFVDGYDDPMNHMTDISDYDDLE
ncbi:MAG TPA: DUF421 domain-containing protein [Bacillota bacterium]